MDEGAEGPNRPEKDATRTTGAHEPATTGTGRLPETVGQYRILAKLGEGDVRTGQTLEHLVGLYEAWARPESAARYRAILEEMQTS